MPSASPLPPGPSVLVLGHAEDMLAGHGCPVCRYASEAAERYLAWFALEAHADAAMIARLTASLGMCPSHTRRLISQPGAATRLTAVYRYVIQAAAGALTARDWRPAICPACQHDTAAAGRALDLVLDAAGTAGFRERYREQGGLCIPHLRAAAARRRRRSDLSRLASVTVSRASARPVSMSLLAGDLGQDADARARVHAVRPPPGAAWTCAACAAAARAQRTQLEQAARRGCPGAEARQELCLCAAHLQDAAGLAGRRAQRLMAWQADCQAVSLAGLLTAPPRRAAPRRAGLPWPRTRRRRPPDGTACPACRARDDAARRELEHAIAGPVPGNAGRAGLRLCVRHLLGLRALDASACPAMTRAAAEHARALAAELDEAFRMQAWKHRHEAAGTEVTAWLRAAAFLDGAVFDGAVFDGAVFDGAVFGGGPEDQQRASRPAARHGRDGTPARHGQHAD